MQVRLCASPLKWLLGRSHAPAFARGGSEHTANVNELISAILAWKHTLSPAPSSQCTCDQLCEGAQSELDSLHPVAAVHKGVHNVGGRHLQATPALPPQPETGEWSRK